MSDGIGKYSKEEIDEYNKSLVKRRMTELPPISEPLILNLDMLVSIANEKNIDEDEKQRIEGILRGDGKPVFLIRSIDDLYNFNKTNTVNVNDLNVEFSQDEISIPADCVSDDAVIKASVNIYGKTIELDDWEISEVNRIDKDNVDKFIVKYKSKEANKISFDENSTVTVTINPDSSMKLDTNTFKFKAVKEKYLFIFDKIGFERIWRKNNYERII